MSWKKEKKEDGGKAYILNGPFLTSPYKKDGHFSDHSFLLFSFFTLFSYFLFSNLAGIKTLERFRAATAQMLQKVLYLLCFEKRLIASKVPSRDFFSSCCTLAKVVLR